MLPISLIPPQAKIALLAAVAVILFGLTFGAIHYHSVWVKAKEEISQLKAEQAQLIISAENCSRGTEKLAEDSAKKEEQIKKAQNQAAKLAKNNEALAQALLNAKPEGDSCAAAVKLFQDYKLRKVSK